MGIFDFFKKRNIDKVQVNKNVLNPTSLSPGEKERVDYKVLLEPYYEGSTRVGQLYSEGNVDHLIIFMKHHPDSYVRCLAAKAIAGDQLQSNPQIENAVAPLIETMKDLTNDESLRKAATIALANVFYGEVNRSDEAKQKAKRAFVEALEDPYYYVRADAAIGLQILPDADATETLLSFMDLDESINGVIDLQKESSRALSAIGSDAAIDGLLTVLAKSSDFFRRRACVADLGKAGNTRALAPLMRMLESEQNKIVKDDIQEAISVLQAKTPNSYEMDQLIYKLYGLVTGSRSLDKINDVKAIERLGDIGDIKALPVLKQLQGHIHMEVGNAADKAIDKIKTINEPTHQS